MAAPAQCWGPELQKLENLQGRHGSNLVQQVLRLATQMDKENTKKAGTSTSEPKRTGR